MTNTLNEGSPAPNFDYPCAPGDRARLSDFDGSRLVLFFYPRDDPPGCTVEAKALSELSPEFAKAGIHVLGVSKDTITKHEKFIAKHNLKIPLISDAEGTMCEDYGVWVEKNMYGRKSMGIARTTFLVDAQGKIQTIWRKVKPAGHAEAVLETATT